MSENLIFIGIVAGIGLVAFTAIGLIFAKLYTRATKEIAFVRTGLGGEKVIKDNGAIVLPVVHDIIPVAMNTLRIEVEKTRKDALITKDRMRVDVNADFYLRVSPNLEGISMAAQTLGSRTTNVTHIKTLMESKFVDVLRAVAAEMTMTEMHEERSEFVQKVQQNVMSDLQKNGLELESVSLTGFDQTDLQYFNENNAFDAEGRARLTKIIEEKRKETNDIEQENRIKVEQRNLQAERQSLDIQRDEELAKLDYDKEVAFKAAEQQAEISKKRELGQQEEKQAEIEKNQAIESHEIAASKLLEEKEIEKTKAIDAARIKQTRDIEVAQQEKEIAIAIKSEEESAARAKAAAAEKERVQAEEAVITAKEVAEANRVKEIEVIEATTQAERDAVAIKVQAAAQKNAAQDEAEAILTKAKAESDAKLLNIEADEKSYKVEADGKRALNEAENALSSEVIALNKTLAMLGTLPQVVEAAVKPLENIDGIKILQGYGTGNVSATGTSESSGGLAEQITNAALQYRANAPLIDNMLREVGMVSENGTLQDLITGNDSPLAPIKTDVDVNNPTGDDSTIKSIEKSGMLLKENSES